MLCVLAEFSFLSLNLKSPLIVSKYLMECVEINQCPNSLVLSLCILEYASMIIKRLWSNSLSIKIYIFDMPGPLEGLH